MYDSMTSHIRELLDRVPVIDRCSSVVWKDQDSPEIHKVSLTEISRV